MLQVLSKVEEICEAVAETLDTMYDAKFSTKTQSRHLIHRILRKATGVSLKPRNLEPYSAPALLQRSNPVEAIRKETGSNETSMKILRDITANERAKAEYHEHHRTCRKGFNGRCGCRLAKASGICDGTHCVFLEPIQETAPADQDDSGRIAESKDEKTKYSYRVWDPIVELPHTSQQYNLRNPLERHDHQIIVWELDWPLTNFIYESSFHPFDIAQAILESSNGEDKPSIRQKIKSNIKACLEYEDGTIGNPYKNESKLWEWVDNVEYKVLLAFYKKFTEELKMSNGYVVDHNVPLFYCTGSHNNILLLGATSQAKSAIFYIAPYISKGKMTLSACMTVIEKARNDVKKYPSKADNAKSKRRLAQYFITKMLNKLNAYVELSDYQVAAMLLNLPSRITSDVFSYSDPYASIAFRNDMHERKNQILREDRIFAQQNDAIDRMETQTEFGVSDPFDDNSVESESNQSTEELEDNNEEELEDSNEGEHEISIQQQSYGYVLMYQLEKPPEGLGK